MNLLDWMDDIRTCDDVWLLLKRYEGHWENNLKQGKGKYSFGESEEYLGEFKANKFHGRGTYRFPNGQVIEGTFDNGRLVQVISQSK